MRMVMAVVMWGVIGVEVLVTRVMVVGMVVVVWSGMALVVRVVVDWWCG